MNRRLLLISSTLITALAGCVTSPTGRKQLHLLSDSEMSQMGVASFDQLKQQQPIDRNATVNTDVMCVVDAVGRAAVAAGASHVPAHWEVVVFEDPTPNAFALPGGKIGVHTGIFKVAKTPAELATVIGHEMSHVIADHGNERVSTAMATQTGLEIVQAILAPQSGENAKMAQTAMALLGVGAQVGILLPFSRADETEADRMGLDLMARAGFDPHEAINLWKNFEAAGGGQPPQFLSDHPSHGTRIADLEARMPHAYALYQSAEAGGIRPTCRFERPTAQR